MLELRNITPDEFERWMSTESRAHGNRLNHDPEHLRPRFDLSRSIAVFEDGQIVGGCHSHLLEMSIPGGTSVVAGVSNVEVQPTHTRRGIMTQMMRHQIDGIHERGEPLAALFATESGIYGRFGYGIGAVHEQWSIEKRHSAYDRRLDSPGRLEFVAPADIMKMLPEVSRRGTQGRSAVFQRAMHHWEDAANDPIHSQGGSGGVFYVAYVEDGRIDGYACYRTQRPTVTVNELVATTREASAALWRFCFDLDLYERTEAARRPTDDPFPGCWPTRAGSSVPLATACGFASSTPAPRWSSGPTPAATAWCWKSATISATGTGDAGVSRCRRRAATAARSPVARTWRSLCPLWRRCTWEPPVSAPWSRPAWWTRRPRGRCSGRTGRSPWP